jgi:hypothetical protein
LFSAKDAATVFFSFPAQKVNIMVLSSIVPTFKGSSSIVLAYPNLPLFVNHKSEKD